MPTEAPNTLRSRAKYNIVDIISQGPTKGIVNGAQSIYLDDTPIQNADGTYNFPNFDVTRDVTELPVVLPTGSTAPVYPGIFPASENTVNVGVKVTKNSPEGSGSGDGSVTRTITDASLDSARVTLRIPALATTNTATGDIVGGQIAFNIFVKPSGGAFSPIDAASGWATWPIGSPSPDVGTGIELTVRISGDRTTAKHISWQYSKLTGSTWGDWVEYATLDIPATSPSQQSSGFYNWAADLGNYTRGVKYLPAASYKAQAVVTGGTGTAVSQRWYQPVAMVISGKTVSPYDVSYNVPLPDGGAPWDIKVERVTGDTVASNYQDDLYWLAYTEIVDNRFSWPNIAGARIAIDAESFGGNVPTRSYDYMGLIVKVPANYDSYNRTYTGIWNGTFKDDWTDNPAWIFYDLLTNKRYGLGDNIDAAQIDKYALYQIAQYCDELVDAPNGEQEPRYTCSCVINTQSEAYELLTAIASAFRGMIYLAGGMITPVADMPSDPVLNVGPANVIDGTFTYQGASRKARHTVARVSWNNPDDGYKLNVELYEDTEAIRKYGYRPVDINAFGCTSRGLARRWGKWSIVSDNDAPDTVTYKAGFDHFAVRPGDVINIADPNYSGEQLFGLIADVTDNVSPATHTITLDRAVTRIAGDTSELQLTLADGTILALDVAVLTNTTSAEITVDSSELTTVPLAGASWLLKKGTVEPRQWRVISISEDEPHIYQVTAMLYDPNKYASIETGLNFAEADFTAFPSGPMPAPTGVAQSEFLKQTGSAILECVTLSWTRPDDARADWFEAQFQQDGFEWQSTTPNLTGVTSVDILGIVPGVYNFRVRAQDTSGLFRSAWTTLATQTLLGKQKAPENVTDFAASVEKFGILLTWTPVSDIDIDYYEIRSGASWAAGTVISQTKSAEFKYEDATTGAYTFWIAAKDTSGNYSATPATIGATVSAQATPTIIATAVNGGIQLTIAGITSRGFKAYEIQRREAPAEAESTINSNVLTKIFTDSDITTLGYVKSWQYRVRALDQNGSASGWSDFTTATTPKQIENDDITANQIIAKHFTTHLDVGLAQDGVLFNSGGIQAWCDGVKTVDIPVSGNPTFSGTVTAGAGFVGGWCIEAGRLCAQNASLYSGLANTARVEMGTGSYSAGINSANAATDISFWAGSTFANRATAPFNVLANGAMNATKGLIGGWCIETNCLHSTNVLMASNGTFQTKNFASGNRGWKIDQFGMAEFNDVRARGSIKTTVFEKDEISVVGGRTLIRPAGVVSCYDYTATLNTSACVALTARWAQLTCLLGYSSAMPTMTFADYAEYYAAEAEFYRQTSIALGCAIYQTAILEADYSDIAKDAYFTDCWNLLNEILDATEIVPTFASMSYAAFIAAEESYFDSMAEVLDDPRPFVASISENDTVVYLDEVDSFDVGDIVRIKDADLAGDYWSRVTGTGCDLNGCYLNLSWLHGDLFPMTSGQAAVNYGVTGSGGILLDGQAPAIDVYTHDGAPWLNTNLWLRLGNLAGWGTINHNVFGIAVGLPEANHMSYRADTGILSITGAINITGGSGIANFSDAGALATASDLDGVPNGATYYKTTANEVTGAGRAFSGLDSNNSLVTKVLPGVAIGTPAGSGLYLGSDVMGFYNSGWKTYMDNSGNFALIGGGTHGLGWNANTGVLTIAGAVSILSGSGYGNLTDKPTNLAGINSTEGSKLTGIEAGADVTSTHTSADTTNVAGTAAATVRDNASNALANAATAQSTANAAVSSAATANALLADIAADDKFTPDEKQAAKKEWDIIVSEKTKNDAQADAFTVSKVAYGAAYDALNSYITPFLANLTTTSDITGTTFRATFKAYYDARTDILNAIAAKAKALADAAQSDATDALANAATAQSTANAAVSSAATANGLLADIASDNKLTPDEKQSTKKEWDIIVSEKTKNDTQADAFSVSKTAYGVAYTTLSDYITPLLSDLTATSNITGTTFRTNFKNYYDARTDILNAIAAKAKALADAAQGTANTAVSNAATAQSAADDAQIDATAALNSLADIASDSKITPVEKLEAKQRWDTIVAEGTPTTGTIPVQATAFGVADTDFDTDYAALNTYLNTTLAVFSNMTTTTTVVRSDWNTAWKNYYDERTKLLNAIAAKAKELADAAQGTANTAVSNAATAQGTANAAAASALTANNLLADIADDNKLVPSEKHSVRKEWDIIAAEKAGINAQSTTFGITTENTTYNNDFQALATYLNAGTTWSSGIPSWISDANLSTTTTIVGATFRANFKAYYDARTALLNAISAKAKTLADTAQSTANNAASAAATAQTTANTAVTNAATANGLLADIAADNKLVPSEKQAARKEWDVIAAEQPINSLHAMGVVGFTPGLPEAGFNETASDAYWSGAWTLLNALLDESNAEPAFAAQTYAAFVAEEAGYYTLVKQVIDSEIITVPPTPDVLALNTTYNATFQALANYLNAGATWTTGVPSWISDANMSATTDITGSTFRSTWKAYYDARTALLNAIAARAQIIADLAQAAAGSVSLRVDSTLDVNNNLITAVIPKSAVVPIGTGLFLGSDYLGYYNGSTWKTYMDRNGNFYLGGSSAGCGLAWDSAKNCLSICGCVTSCAGNIAGWNINAKCISKGNLILNSDGAISGCYSGTTTGWCINAAGDAVFNNATVRGTVCASEGCIGCYSLVSGVLSATTASLTEAVLKHCFYESATCWACQFVSSYYTCIKVQDGTNCANSELSANSLSVVCSSSATSYAGSRIDDYGFSAFNIASSSATCSNFFVNVKNGGNTAATATLLINMIGGTSCYAFCTNGQISVSGTVYPSDRNLKCAFEDYNVLDKLRRMPIQRWKFKDEDKLWHVGPVAQDFHDIFNFGYECTRIPNLDGLALRAAQELDIFVQRHESKIEKLEKDNVSIREKLQKLECEMAAIREMIN